MSAFHFLVHTYQKLFLHQAEIDSLEVSDQDVLAEVEMRTNWFIDQMGSKEKMEEYYNKTSSQIREMLRESVRNSKLVQKMQQKMWIPPQQVQMSIWLTEV